MTKYLTCAETAKLVRSALKEEFPGQKFSVKSKTYAGGASITVRWFEGPATDKVDKVAHQFAGATFDPMIDLKSHHHSKLNGEEVQFGADFIFTERVYSDETRHRIAKMIAKRYGRIYSPEQWNTMMLGAQWLSSLVWQELQRMDLRK